MKKCQNCKSARVAFVNGKVSDSCQIVVGDKEHLGYVPSDVGVCDDKDEDYLNFRLCLDCGRVQGRFPRPKTSVEKGK